MGGTGDRGDQAVVLVQLEHTDRITEGQADRQEGLEYLRISTFSPFVTRLVTSKVGLPARAAA